MKVGIVGLPNVGKSTLFNALLKKRVALSANYPFATVEPNIGIVAVPDDRLNKLAELVAEEEGMIPQGILKQVQDDTLGVEAQKFFPPIIPAIVEFVDIAGLVKGASTGAGLGNKFLSHIREVDAIIEVLRDFSDENIVREGSVSPLEDKVIVETELILADLETIEKLIVNTDKDAKSGRDALDYKKLEILNKIKADLDEGKFMGSYFAKAKEGIEEKLQNWFAKLPLLSLKPVLYVFNVNEEEYAKRINNVILEGVERPIGSKDSISPLGFQNDDSVIICARLEEELVELSESERADYLKELGIEETGLERLIKKAYELLGLASFLTAGKKEVRAWTFSKGMKAPQAAGVIHTDFEKNFIRAQVISYEKYVEAGSLSDAKKSGWVRTEGKDYIVQDGDVIEFLIGS